MNIFVWKSYGELEISSISTSEQKSLLKTELVQALQREGETDVDEDMSLGYVIELVYDQLGNSDVFEHGTGIYLVKE